jgi:hypothetical protein
LDERDTRELRAVCDQLKQLMRREIDAPTYSDDALRRAGEVIDRSTRQGWSPFADGSHR